MMMKGRESKAAKKLLTAALAVMMAVAFMPAGSVFAASKTKTAKTSAPKRAAVETETQNSSDASKPENTGKSIYLNGKTGDDANDGSAADKAVKTFSKAKELAEKDQSISTIYVTGTVQISDTEDLDLSGTKAVVKRDSGFKDYLFDVAGKDANATLKNITIDGNSEQAAGTEKSLIKVEHNSTLNIQKGAVLQNNKIAVDASDDMAAYHADGGAVFATNNGESQPTGATVNMSDGVIQNNQACVGGGVAVERSTFNMTGGVIQNNSVKSGKGTYGYASGGGVGLFTSNGGFDFVSTFNFSDGKIIDNTSEESGGGIGAGTSFGSDKIEVKMTGGLVDGNTSYGCGGGLFIQAGVTGKQAAAEVTGGSITNNHMAAKEMVNHGFGGGGIYVNGYNKNYSGYSNGELHLKNAVIMDNHAAMEGGGYASCPSSETHIYVTDGAAIYGNSGSNAKDLYIQSGTSKDFKAHYGDPEYTVSPTMLGGQPYHWKNDENKEVSLDSLDGKLQTSKGEKLSLHTDESLNDEVKKNEAQVIISGNTSTYRGGGIGSNGTVDIGTAPKGKIAVHKTWKNEGSKPDQIQIDLYRSTEKNPDKTEYLGYFNVTPDENGNWNNDNVLKYIAEKSSDNDSYVYTAAERKADDWEPAEEKTTAVYDADSHTYTFNLANQTRHFIIQGKKVWNDENNKDGKRPAAINVSLYANGHKVATHSVTAKDAEKDHSSIWDFSFNETNLAKYKDADGNLNFTVADDDNPTPYLQTQVGDKENDYTIINSYKPEEFCIPVWVSWDDNQNQDNVRPDSVTVHVTGTVPDKTDASKTTTIESKDLTLTRNGGWYDTDTLHNLPVYSGGQKITYTLTVEKADSVNNGLKNYTTTVTGCAEKGFQVTNVYEPKTTDVTVTKKWSDNDSKSRPDKITVDLKGNGTVLDEATLDAKDQTDAKDKNTWTYTFKNVPVSKDGKALTYNVSEEVPDGYSAKVVKNSDASFTITNTLKPNTSGGGGGTVIVQPANDHKVTFHPNNGDADTSQNVKDGAQVSKPYDPSNSGYKFEGWYTDSTFKNAYDFSTPVKSDLNLYAKWTKVTPAPTPESNKVKGILLPKVIANGSNEQTLTWTALTNVDGYYVYRAKCNIPKPLTIYKFKKVADVSASSPRVFKSYGLKKGVAYKYYVVGYKNVNGQKMIVQKSVTVHSVAGNLLKKKYAKYTNVKKVSVTKNAVTLKVGKTYKIQPSVKGVLSGCEILQKDHAAMFRYVYIKDGKNIKVSQDGTVKALKAGKCNVYVLGTNGVRTKVAVTVVK